MSAINYTLRLNLWIDVADALPPLNIDVLVTGPCGPSIERMGMPKDGNIWNVRSKKSVTHWMHLPVLDLDMEQIIEKPNE